MKIVTKRILAGAAAAAIMLVLCWIGGFNFDKRGEGAVTVAIWTLFAAGFAVAAPYNETPQ